MTTFKPTRDQVQRGARKKTEEICTRLFDATTHGKNPDGTRIASTLWKLMYFRALEVMSAKSDWGTFEINNRGIGAEFCRVMSQIGVDIVAECPEADAILQPYAIRLIAAYDALEKRTKEK